MTEKRFKLGYVCGDFGLIDNGEWIDLCSMSENSIKNAQICINKMNELAEENEYLKKELQSLRKEDIKDKVAKRDYTSMELYGVQSGRN